MQRVIVDMDEVIADPMNDMISWYRQQYGLDVDYNKMLEFGSWEKGFPEQHQALVHERLLSPGFFRNLPVIKDSVEVLEEINQKYELYIVSSAMEFPNSLKDKHDWLLEHFPFLSWRQLTLCGDKKLVYGDFMIDDHVKNLKYFKGKPYIFSAAHNLNVEGYDRISNWAEAATIFLQ
ncbi:MAG: 5'(3')-deoxyribonucleotidase [Candidatus Pseudobacter hemicellulosilyticus]|uniref:5'(3')-deoxyribonucleotidase n=1 Tax=Candidatus Pseudobacter hemicellulosilyticus TaxID=3121375 RepID=A0AAJ5WSA8_9BACT|nr:MAG: 5'(3')-deoxyribonucleotidase [Pseudobacter sp.]